MGDPSANEAVVRRIEDAWNANDLDALDDLIAEGFVAHTPGADLVPAGLQGAKMAHMGSLESFPDRKGDVLDVFGEGDFVVVHAKMTGTNRGGLPWAGVPPNQHRVDFDWITIYRLQDGKVVETWAQIDVPTLMQQVGAMPAP